MSVTWFVPRSDLSPDQLRAVDLPVREHSIVLGAPGSGKTLVLLHRAKRLIEEEGVPPERLRIFVFTNTLKDYIRSTLALLDIPETCVTTFDYWCREFYTTFVARRVPFAHHGPDFDAIRTGVLNKLRGGTPLTTLGNGRDPRAQPEQQTLLGDDDNRPSTSPQTEFPEFFAEVIGCPLYDAALVDEGQDLTPQAFEILRRVARHVTVCMDSRQQLYEQRCEEPDILQALGLRKCNLTILGAYRCCPYITRLAASLLTDPIMPRLVPSSFLQVRPERLAKLLFVGITRATQWVYMSTVEGPMLPVILQIAGLEKDRTITIQRSGDTRPSGKPRDWRCRFKPRSTRYARVTCPLRRSPIDHAQLRT